jgi:hypothetical protein
MFENASKSHKSSGYLFPCVNLQQLWMIITPLPGPADGRTKGGYGGIMPSMLSEQPSAEGV